MITAKVQPKSFADCKDRGGGSGEGGDRSQAQNVQVALLSNFSIISSMVENLNMCAYTL